MKMNVLCALVTLCAAVAGCASAEPSSGGRDVVDPCTQEVVGSKEGTRVTFNDGTSVDVHAIPMTTLSSPPDVGSMCGGTSANGGVRPQAMPSGSCYSWHDYEETSSGYAECVGMSCSNGFVTQSCYFGS